MKLHNKRNNGTVTVDDKLAERLDKALWEPVKAKSSPAPKKAPAKKASKSASGSDHAK